MDLFSAVYSYFFIDFLKINFLSYWFCLLLTVVAILSQSQVHFLIGRFGSSILIFVVFTPMDELALPGSGYDVLVCAESKVSDRCHLSELHIPGFGCPQQRLRNSTPGAQGMVLYVWEGFCSFRQPKSECSCH